MQHEYLRSFNCYRCDNPDGTAAHLQPHGVWVQDIVVPLGNGRVIFWKDATCSEIGQPCCQYQSPCEEVLVEDLWKTRRKI